MPGGGVLLGLGADKTGHWTLGVVIGVAAGAATGLLHAFFSVTLRADQIVGGTAISFLALGITGYLFIRIYGEREHASRASTSTRRLARLPLRHSARPPRRLPRRYLHEHGLPHLDGAGDGLRHLGCHLQDAVRATASKRGRAPACGRHGRHKRLPDPLCGGHALGCAGGGGGRVVALGFVNSFEPSATARTRIHRSRCPHLPGLATVWRTCRMPSVRVLERARDQPAGVLAVGVDLVRGAAVRAYPRCRRGGHRALDSTGCYWSSVRQAVAAWGRAAQVPPGARSSRGSRRSTLPVAIYVTRFSGEYELLHAGFAIPLAAVLGFVALVLAGRSAHAACSPFRMRGLRASPVSDACSGSSACAWPPRQSSRSSSTACWSTSARGTKERSRSRPWGLGLDRLRTVALRIVRHRLQPPRGPTAPGARLPRLEEPPPRRSGPSTSGARRRALRHPARPDGPCAATPTRTPGGSRSRRPAVRRRVQHAVRRGRRGCSDSSSPGTSPPRRDRSGRESRIAVLALFAIAVAAALDDRGLEVPGAGGVRKVPGLASPGAGRATHSPSSAAQRTRLAVTAVSGGSWMEVRAGSSGGKLLYSGTLERVSARRSKASAPARPRKSPERGSPAQRSHVSLPVGTTFVVTPRRIVRATS